MVFVPSRAIRLRMSDPGLFGEAPILFNATAVTPAFHEEPVRVLSDATVRHALGVVSVSVRPASIELLPLGGGHAGHDT